MKLVLTSGPDISLGTTCLVLLLFCAGAETQLRLTCYLEGLMCKGVVLQSSSWELPEDTLQPNVPPPRGFTEGLVDVTGEERSGEGRSCMTSNMKGDERSGGSKLHDQY